MPSHFQIPRFRVQDPRSMVYDLADTVKFTTVVPLAFEIAKANPSNVNKAVRHACRDMFLRERLVDRLFANLQYIVAGEECM